MLFKLFRFTFEIERVWANLAQNSHMHAQRIMMCGDSENRKINHLGAGSLFHA